MVIWLIGLSGSGKSTLASEVVARANKNGKSTILLDGDAVREIFGNDLGHSMSDRFKNAERICQLGKFLDSQGFNVVAAILSIFPESREWNRKNIENYFEVFIDTPIEILIERDSKGLYSKFISDEVKEVVGMDIEFQKPNNSDLVIENIGSKDLLLSYVEPILDRLLKE
jgi:adenylyl-sulfate kinase